jgi:hypothetical protein
MALLSLLKFSQVIDFIGFYENAHLVSNLSKPLICKALQALKTSFQQSYPQIFWSEAKAL